MTQTPSVAASFGTVASAYARYRPTYPPGLFDWIAAAAPGRQIAWDCACGSGQATHDLAARFEHVIATDASAEQIAAARPHAQIEFRVATAERSGLAPASVDALTVGQALHWFDLPAFIAEVRRVLRPGGLLAAWTYNMPVVRDSAVQQLLMHMYRDTVGAFWPPGRQYVESGYRTISIPFAPLGAPSFTMNQNWMRGDLVGYVSSWSAVARYRTATGDDPIRPFERQLAAIWPDAESQRIVDWPLSVRSARI
jgi:SAM-dependent methyltransferase